MSEYPWIETEQGNKVIDRCEVIRTIALEIDAVVNGDTDADYHCKK